MANNPQIGTELSSIDFKSMIGGPLVAVIQAQAQSALATVDFIKSVGFADDETPIYVDFKYKKYVPDDDGVMEDKDFILTVPILSLLPIPSIMIKDVTIDFNAKINSVQVSQSASNSSFGASLTANAGFKALAMTAKLSCSFSSSKSSSSSDKTDRTYSLAIHVHAVQDELPEGLDRVLRILENSITDVEA
jgi:hypothetical protein